MRTGGVGGVVRRRNGKRGKGMATKKEKTKEQRLRLGDFINKHLERAGSRNRVDMRNYKERGVEKPQYITYKEMKDPVVEKAYKAKIQAQAELLLHASPSRGLGLVAV